MAKSSPQRVVVERTGSELASRVESAGGLFGSFLGLMFRRDMPAGAGMIFRPAMGIHTFFMRFDLDLIYLDKADVVTKIRSRMVPWRLDFSMAAACIELNAGEATAVGLQKGDRLIFVPTE